MIPIQSETMLHQLQPHFEEIKAVSERYNTIGFHLYTFNNDRIICRNFAPRYDINEEAATGQCHKVKQFFLKYHIITRPSGTQKDRILATKHTSLDTAYSTLAENCTKINQSA